MDEFTPLLSLTGGLLIGVAAISLLLSHGRIAGISGIISGILHPEKEDSLWRVVFILGMLAGALLIGWFHPDALAVEIDVSPAAILLAGFLVGMGTRIGNGCTSGHGVCGIGRLSVRSIVAVIVFFSCAAITTWFIRHVMGGF
jgi:uncharacterized membrane protein YedE/YeeE